ncbi:hypothetical protein AAFF_G00382240 [Aldrovandia affinis]|uniref:Uncharacterized protein n=1 Tax=Aldrovandia affinis TaxID=143900 RepID=A0AAD7X0P3_9TELE|nr:hypothetical protein AAFF_G00382240 [Aldrovandia affinis]
MVEFHAFTKLDVFQPPFVRSLVPLRVTCMEATSTKAPQTPEEEERETSWNTGEIAILLPPACVPRPGHALLADSSLSGKRARSAWVDAKQTPGACALCPGPLLRLLLLGP